MTLQLRLSHHHGDRGGSGHHTYEDPCVEDSHGQQSHSSHSPCRARRASYSEPSDCNDDYIDHHTTKWRKVERSQKDGEYSARFVDDVRREPVSEKQKR